MQALGVQAKEWPNLAVSHGAPAVVLELNCEVVPDAALPLVRHFADFKLLKLTCVLAQVLLVQVLVPKVEEIVVLVDVYAELALGRHVEGVVVLEIGVHFDASVRSQSQHDVVVSLVPRAAHLHDFFVFRFLPLYANLSVLDQLRVTQVAHVLLQAELHKVYLLIAVERGTEETKLESLVVLEDHGGLAVPDVYEVDEVVA